MSKRVLSIIVGGTHTRAAIATADSPNSDDVLFWQKPTVRSVEGILESVKQVRETIGAETLDAMVVAVPGRVAENGRRSQLPPAFGCAGEIDLYSRISNFAGDSIFIENDAKLMALGEYVDRGCQDSCLALLVIGTGIGCGLVINGDIFRGGNGAAGEVGYLLTQCDGALIPVREICRRAKLLKDSTPTSSAPLDLNPEWLREYATATTVVLTAIVSLLAPDTIILSGAVAENNFEALSIAFTRTLAACEHGIMRSSLERMKIMKSSLGHRAAVRGAFTVARLGSNPRCKE